MNTGIYCIEHVESGKKYVGSAASIDKRWRDHRRDLCRGTHPSRYLQNAWNKYGEVAFAFRKLLVCAKKDLLMYEQRCIDGYEACDRGAGFNISPTAGSCLGLRLTEAAKKKIGDANRGRHMSEENKELLRRLNTGKKMSPEAVARTAAAHLGRKRSLGVRQAMRAALVKRAGVKLNMSRAEEIRALCLGATRGTKTAVAKQYGVSPSTVSLIVHNKQWKPVE